jgi:hypothetical protein
MGAGNKPMLDGIIMNIIQMSLEILFVLNRVLPESTLPDIALAVLPP